MSQPKLCLTLTGKTLEENLEIVNKYRKHIDLVELRADFLEPDECLLMHSFPSMVDLPCILTIRRVVDGGCFVAGEGSRIVLFARTLVSAVKMKKFAYVDFEEDFFVPSLQDAASIDGVRIIRSYHNMTGAAVNIAEKLSTMRFSTNEIPKIACMAKNMHEVAQIFNAVNDVPDIKSTEQIICVMGEYGLPSRVLAKKFNSYLSYCSAPEMVHNLPTLGHAQPEILNNVYRYHSIDDKTVIFGIIGYPLGYTLSPQLHNKAYEKLKMNAVYLPLKTNTIYTALEIAFVLGIQGLSVTVPHKEMVLPLLKRKSKSVESIGACNTLVLEEQGWAGYNTDAIGFEKAFLNFCSFKNPKVKNLAGKKIAIIGAGGAAKAVAYVVHKLRGKACIFNRTLNKAKQLAEKYDFKYAKLSADSYPLLEKYSAYIIQTTSKGLNTGGAEGNVFSESSKQEIDPLYFYEFTGNEELYDLIYSPEVTPVMARAKRAGCHVENGYKMLEFQAEAQIELFAETYNRI